MSTVAATAGPALRAQAARVPDAVFALGVTGALAAVASANGGYFPTSWGWSALVFAWVALLALLVGGERSLTVEGAVFAFGVTAVTAWTFLSAIWSWDVSQSILEGERSLVLLTAVTSLLLVTRSRRLLLGSLLAGITGVCAYSLATRLFPGNVGRFDATAGYRLFTPLGYWNSLGLFAVIGCLLALGFVARGRLLVTRGAAAAAIVLLSPTIFFTFSRGSWLTLGVALVFLLALDPRRLQATLALAVAGAAPAAAVFLAWRSHGLTTQNTTLAHAIHDGHRLAGALVALMAFAALLAVGFGLAERRIRPGNRVRRVYGAVLVVAIVVALVAGSVHWGSPPTLAKRTWHAFSAPPQQTGANLNERLFQFSSNGRLDLWHAALHEYHSAPLVGTGAGTYDLWWNQHRPAAEQVRDAHSLYLETLGEMGVVGLALLVLMLAVPLVGAWRSRHHPLVPFAAAGFVAWLVHAGVDWDLEITAVTLLALACAVAAVHDPSRSRLRLAVPVRAGAGIAAAAIAAFALVAAVGNRALARADDALLRGQPSQAEDHARQASRWMPWSADPWILIGEIQGHRGQAADALQSLRRAVAKEPKSYLAWYALAGAESGRSARRAAAKVIVLNPHSDEAAEMRSLLAKRP